MNDIQRMKELIEKITAADVAYFQKDEPIMSDLEYDKLVLELKMLERATGIHFANSPIGKVPSDEKEGLKTVQHTKPMLSCQETKDVNEMVEFAGERDIVLSWKMDGLTLVLRYEKGKLTQAITRGAEGVIGEDVTHTVKHFRNIPLIVPCKDSFEVRGEGVLSWEDAQILTKLGESNATHPRSIASGAVRSVTENLGKLAHLDFFAFELIKEDSHATKIGQLEFLKENNFAVVEYKLVSPGDRHDDIAECISEWIPEGFAYPVDGIVAEYDDLAYGKSLGSTAHHEKRMMALKWKDEVKETKFRGVELRTTRTGVVSIIGLFDEVVIDGTRVHRASLHNLSNFEKYKFGVGDIIKVYKANMIVPQIAENRMMSGTYELPEYCPCCGERLTVQTSQSGVRNLYCPNENCLARHAKKVARFCDKSAMNIDGLSASVIEKMMAYGWIGSYADIYHLDVHRDDIINRPGFGTTRYRELWTEIQSSRKCHMYQFLVGIDIPHLGPEAAKALHQYFYGSMEAFEEAVRKNFAFSHIAEVPAIVEKSIYRWFEDESNVRMMHAVMTELEFIGMHRELDGKQNPFMDTTVVVTGTFENFTREGILEILATLGAKTTDKVTKDTNYLIYGSLPGNKKVSAAMENRVTMLSEKDFGKMIERKAEKEERISEISPWEALKEKENDSFTPDKDFEIEHIVRERTLYKDGTAKVTRTENWTLKKYRGHDEHVVIPDYITSIAYQAFLKCDTIKTVSIPQSVKVIGSYAFCGCKSLESICIPKNVREIRECAFTGCENLKSAYFEHEKYMGNLSLWAFRRANNVTLYGTEKALGWLRNYKKDVPPFELHD